MKLAAWHLTLVGGALLLAGSLRAQTPESLPEPKGSPSTNWQQSGPTLNYWSARQGFNAQSTMAQSSPEFAGDIMPSELHGDESHAPHDAYPFSSSQWWRNGCWFGEFDFVIWNRTRPGERIIGVDSQGAFVEPNRTLNKHGNALPLEPGGRGTLGYFLCRDLDNRDHSVEASYLGFNNWEVGDSLIASTPQTLRIPEAPNYGGFNFSDTFTTTYRSSFHSMEIDYRIRNRPGRDRMIMGPDGFWSRQLSPGRTQSMLVGFRGLWEEENFHWTSLRNNVSPDTFSGDFLVHTRNSLFGVQVGGDCLDVHDSWYWGIKGNAGVYCNFTDGSARIAVVDAASPEPLVQGDASDQVPAFFGELNFILGYNVTEHLLLHARWDFALLGGISLAPDQASFRTYLADASPFLSSGGQVFYTGLSLGLEAYW